MSLWASHAVHRRERARGDEHAARLVGHRPEGDGRVEAPEGPLVVLVALLALALLGDVDADCPPEAAVKRLGRPYASATSDLLWETRRALERPRCGGLRTVVVVVFEDALQAHLGFGRIVASEK